MIPIKRYQSCEAPKHVKQRHFVILRTVRKLFLRTENENIVDNTEEILSPPGSGGPVRKSLEITIPRYYLQYFRFCINNTMGQQNQASSGGRRIRVSLLSQPFQSPFF